MIPPKYILKIPIPFTITTTCNKTLLITYTLCFTYKIIISILYLPLHLSTILFLNTYNLNNFNIKADSAYP